MGKYSALDADVFSVFDLDTWKSVNIKTIPSNFVKVGTEIEFIRVNIIPQGKGVNPKSTSGILSIDIFIAAGNGPKRASFIADKLDDFLVGKSIATGTGTTQCLTSSMTHRGTDKDNPKLHRSIYQIPFTYSGV